MDKNLILEMVKIHLDTQQMVKHHLDILLMQDNLLAIEQVLDNHLHIKRNLEVHLHIEQDIQLLTLLVLGVHLYLQTHKLMDKHRILHRLNNLR